MSLNGILLKQLPCEGLTFIGDLLFKAYPSTRVYSSDDRSPYILEWVDELDNGNDLFFIYESSALALKQYIEEKKSHLELITDAKNGVAFFFEGKIENCDAFYIKSIDSIDRSYLPSPNSYFLPEESNDIKRISEYFNFTSIIEIELMKNEIGSYDIIQHALDEDTELFRLHINNGAHVSHGKADTKVLGAVLTSFESFYYELSQDLIRGKDRSKKIDKKDRELNKRISSTEVVINEAASYSIYVRSKQSQHRFDHSGDTPVPTTDSTLIFSKMLSIVSKSSDSKTMEEIKQDHSPAVFTKLKEFASVIKKNDLDIDLDFYSPTTKRELKDKVDLNKAYEIIEVIDKTLIVESENIKVKGKFTAVNTKTRHFEFRTNDDNTHSGYFDELLDNLEELDFTNVYDISINRISEIRINKSVETVKDTIIAFYKQKK